MSELTKKQKGIFAVLREFAQMHTHGSHYEIAETTKPEEIDLTLEQLDEARKIPDEPAEEEASGGHSEDELRSIQRHILGNIGDFMPMFAGVLYSRYLPGMVDALGKSAEADIVRAIIDCERFMAQLPDEIDRGNRIIDYLERLRDLWALSAEPEGPAAPTLRDTLKKLARCNASECQGVFKIYLTLAYSEELMTALEKVGGDVTGWRCLLDKTHRKYDAMDREASDED